MLTARSLQELKKDLELKVATQKELAEKYGVSEQTIYRYNKQFGFGRKKINYIGLELDLKDGNLKKDELAEKYGITPKTVYNVKKRLGLVNARS